LLRSIRARVTVVVAAGALVAIWLPAVAAVAAFSPSVFTDREFLMMLIAATVLLGCVAWLIGRLAARFAVLPLTQASVRLEAIARGQLNPSIVTGSPEEIERLDAAVGEIVRRGWQRELRQATTVGALAHDVRSSLAAMANMLDESASLLDAGGKPLVVNSNGVGPALLSEVRRMQTLTGDLVALMRSSTAAVQEESVEMSPIVQSVARAVQAASGVPIDVVITRSFARTAPVGLVERVLRNLIENAAVAARNCVKVEVLDGLILVADDGPGFPLTMLDVPDNLGRIQSHVSGVVDHGVGFEIASRLAEACGGRVVIQRSTQNGSTVLVYL
jgi:signal transduction histidine kinase